MKREYLRLSALAALAGMAYGLPEAQMNHAEPQPQPEPEPEREKPQPKRYAPLKEPERAKHDPSDSLKRLLRTKGRR